MTALIAFVVGVIVGIPVCLLIMAALATIDARKHGLPISGKHHV